MENLDQNLNQPAYHNFFSHIYIEEKALEYKVTERILSYFKNSKKININHYKDVFCKKNQSAAAQKNSKKLILAVKENEFFYTGSKMCNSFGLSNFYYTAQIMNCMFDCEYCYLQGMYPSANVVIFVNIEDTFKEIEKLLDDQQYYFCISYDSDLLAFEKITGFIESWFLFVRNKKNLLIEIRTKSSNFNLLNNLAVNENIIFAWTISPREIIKDIEKNTASLQNRLRDISSAIEKGYKVRLCIDPILFVRDYKTIYSRLIHEVFHQIDANSIFDISIGVFRVSKEYFKKMSKINEGSKLYAMEFETHNGIIRYPEKDITEMKAYILNCLEEYIDESKIYFY